MLLAAQRKMRITGRRCKRVGGLGDRSQPGRSGEIDLEPVALALIAAGHFRAGVAEMALDMCFFDFRGAGEAGAQRMAGKRQLSFALAEIAANAGGQRGFLHQPRHMLVGQALRCDARVFLGDAAEQWPVGDSTKTSRFRASRRGR